MSVSSELGISPVLLQAISHTLISSESDKNTRLRDRNLIMDKKSPKIMTHILDGMNEPVATLLPNNIDSGMIGSSPDINDGSRDIKNIIIQKSEHAEGLSQCVSPKQESHHDSSLYGGTPPVSMVNVLTALASQHLKSKSVDAPSPETTAAAQVKIETSDVLGQQQPAQPQQIIIYYNDANSDGNTEAAPSPGSNIVVGGVDGNEQVYRVIVQQGEADAMPAEIVEPTEHQARLIAEHNKQMVMDKQAIMVRRAQLLAQHEAMDSFNGDQSMSAGSNIITSIGQDPSAIEHLGTPCPICGDKISGYHYGIFTCESCKGFFKRTVQNKKTFVCHRHGECDINIFNRKKCPACRFAKCVQCGMKLEAIRVDRTRGGRSSYDGCSTHSRISKSSPVDRKVKRMVTRQSGQPSENISHLVAILNHSTPLSQQSGEGGMLQVPELLTDIMNLEPLLSDEDIPLDMVPEGFEDDNDSLYSYLMQLTELRLYKLVRWARNLPQFGAISTDDQILLLQNCWSDLLALGVCWRSIATPGVLALSAGKTINLHRAMDLGFGDVVGRMISLSEHLRHLEVDQYEYVAMKVLLLISPDVKGLKDPGKIMEHQEKLLDALLVYTVGHFQGMSNKFGELLLRLPELARISFIGKEQLLNRLPVNMTSCGLLVELLKGENAAKDL